MWSCVPNALLYLLTYLLYLLTQVIFLSFWLCFHWVIETLITVWDSRKTVRMLSWCISLILFLILPNIYSSFNNSISPWKTLSICYFIFNLSYHLEEFCNEQSPGNSPQSWTCQPAPFLLTSLACWETILLRLFSAIWGRKNHAVFFQCLHIKELQRQKIWQPQDMVYAHVDVCQTLVPRSIQVKFSNIQGPVFMWNLLSCGGRGGGWKMVKETNYMYTRLHWRKVITTWGQPVISNSTLATIAYAGKCNINPLICKSPPPPKKKLEIKNIDYSLLKILVKEAWWLKKRGQANFRRFTGKFFLFAI